MLTFPTNINLPLTKYKAYAIYSVGVGFGYL